MAENKVIVAVTVFVFIMDPHQQLLFLGSSRIKEVYTIKKKTFQYIHRFHNTLCPQAPTPPLPHIYSTKSMCMCV
jgi:hypothetical protein